MTEIADPTADALAIAVRDDLRHHRHMADALRDPTLRFAAMLRQELPDIPEEHVAAVLLRLGNRLPHLLPELRRQQTITEHLVGEYATAFVGIVGEHIHGSIQRRTAPTVKGGA